MTWNNLGDELHARTDVEFRGMDRVCESLHNFRIRVCPSTYTVGEGKGDV